MSQLTSYGCRGIVYNHDRRPRYRFDSTFDESSEDGLIDPEAFVTPPQSPISQPLPNPGPDDAPANITESRPERSLDGSFAISAETPEQNNSNVCTFCSKVFKSSKGVKIHQRSCQSFKSSQINPPHLLLMLALMQVPTILKVYVPIVIRSSKASMVSEGVRVHITSAHPEVANKFIVGSVMKSKKSFKSVSDDSNKTTKVKNEVNKKCQYWNNKFKSILELNGTLEHFNTEVGLFMKFLHESK
ncbi:hypothetical protein M8J77_014768 [Diaphorina citri]|nr:hypothetical protein M8J77_014768 [Diaphorina citri]